MNITELTVRGEKKLSFASDNSSGAHPEMFEALIAANTGHEMSYGYDSYTERLQDVVRSHFGEAATAYPVFNGTGANVISLQAVLPSWGAVICSSIAHINTAENAAPERIAGTKLLYVDAPDGKLTPDLVAAEAHDIGNEHHAQPAVVSITQGTEVGTVYTVDEVRAISERAHSLGLKVHMDGSRLCNAAASLGVALRDITTDAGVDILSFGGTKNGLLYGELVVVLDPAIDLGLKYIRKYDMQLASKMRYISAQFIALLSGDLWLESARRANERAARLAELVGDVPGVEILFPVEANMVGAIIPPDLAAELAKHAAFQVRNQATGEVRWMCSHDTTEDDVTEFARLIRELA